VLKAGWLQKRGPTATHSWRPFWCALRGHEYQYVFEWYADEEKATCRGRAEVFPTTRMMAVSAPSAPGAAATYVKARPFAFVLDVNPDDLRGKDRHILYLDASTAADFSAWSKAFKRTFGGTRRSSIASSVFEELPELHETGRAEGRTEQASLAARAVDVIGQAQLDGRLEWAIPLALGASAKAKGDVVAESPYASGPRAALGAEARREERVPGDCAGLFDTDAKLDELLQKAEALGAYATKLGAKQAKMDARFDEILAGQA